MKLKRNNSAANVIGKTHFEKSLAGVAIIVIIVLHFASQFSFSQKENTSQIEAMNQRSVEIRREMPKPPADVVQVPEGATTQPAAPAVVVRPEEPEEEAATTAPPPRTIIRKKEARESKTERLRRLEKFLTGV